MSKHLSQSELEAGLPDIRSSPQSTGLVKFIVCRPAVNERTVLDEAQLDTQLGLIGDNWAERAKAKGKETYLNNQINVMNARAIALIAHEPSRWALAGDQFYVDFDLSYSNIPPGTQLAIGSAVIEVTPDPHRGCKKFAERFGKDAVLFVNSDEGVALNARGINAKIVQSGTVRVGDTIKKL